MPPLPTRFYEGPDWRILITTLASEGLSSPTKFTTDNKLSFGLASAASYRGSIRSNEYQISREHTDGLPVLEANCRFLYGFRREGGTPPWTCRFGGIVMEIKDSGADHSRTEFAAFDPRAYLAHRLVRDSLGVVADATFTTGTEVGEIAATLLQRTIDAVGSVYIDAGETYSGTASWAGTIEATATLAGDLTFPAGTTVLEAWEQLEELGALDIALDPIYDMVNRAGYLAELSIYAERGAQRDDAVFAWDRPPRSVARTERDTNGGRQANSVFVLRGQGGDADVAGFAEDAGSQAVYGVWETAVVNVENPSQAEADAIADTILLIRATPPEVFTLTPSPERGAPPFTGWWLGDRVPYYASSDFRKAVAGLTRVYGAELELAPEGYEVVSGMRTRVE